MPLWLCAIRRAFCNVTVHLHGTDFLQYSRRVFLWCDNVYLWKFNCTWATLLLNVRISFSIRLGSYIPPYDVEISAKERVILLSGHPNGDTQLLNLIYLFVSRHEVHSMNTHTAERRLIKSDNTERSTRHWSRRNHRVTDTFCNCIEDRTIGLQTHSTVLLAKT